MARGAGLGPSPSNRTGWRSRAHLFRSGPRCLRLPVAPSQSSSFLWRFHKVHHSDRALDVTTALRFHPGELLLSGIAKAFGSRCSVPPPVAWFLFEALVSASAQFHHADLRLAPRLERALRWLWVTPAFTGLIILWIVAGAIEIFPRSCPFGIGFFAVLPRLRGRWMKEESLGSLAFPRDAVTPIVPWPCFLTPFGGSIKEECGMWVRFIGVRNDEST